MSDHAVIFDLDGTLVDSIDDITASLNHALDREAMPTHSRSAVVRMVGDGVRMLVRRAAGDVDEVTLERILDRFAEHYAEHCVDLSTLFPGVDQLLDRCASAGWRMAVLSNKPDDFTRTCCDALLDRWPFAVILGARDGVPKKPDPAAAFEIARLLEVPAARTCFVGDSPVDVETGRAAGMRSIAVAWGYREAAVLAATDPDAIASTPADLADLLLCAQ